MLKCWDRKALEVPWSCSTWEWTQRQGKGEAKNSNKEIHESWASGILAPVAANKACSPVQERELTEILCQESFPWLPHSFKHILLSNRQAAGTCQCVTHCQSSTQTHPGEEWALCRVTAPKQTEQEETIGITTLPTCYYCQAWHCSSITQGWKSQE